MSSIISGLAASSLAAAMTLWGSHSVASVASNGSPALAGEQAEPLVTTKKVEGASAIRVHNCHQDKKQIHVWRIEVATGAKENMGDLDVDPANPCPGSDGASVTVKLEDGKAYRIVTTDGPHSDTDCSEDDPNTVNCQRLVIEVVKGQDDGPTVDVTSG